MSTKRMRHHVNPLGVQIEHTFEGFGNDKPIIVDVGADHGEFSEGLLEQLGESKNFIIFEVRSKLAQRLEEKFKSYKNVRVFDGDAGRNFKNILVPCLSRGAIIEEIYVNFPDPWFKGRHKKRRFVTERFLDACKEWISHETTWIFQTDQKSLFDETKEILRAVGTNHVAQFINPPYGVTTKWENAKVKEGEIIYRMKFWISNTRAPMA